jgi:hypothetical protein
MTMSCLARRSDAVIIDLRAFPTGDVCEKKSPTGCERELRELLNATPIERIAILVDCRTNKPYLESVLEDAWKNLAPSSPNAGREQQTRIIDLDEFESKSIDKVLAAVFVLVPTP